MKICKSVKLLFLETEQSFTKINWRAREDEQQGFLNAKHMYLHNIANLYMQSALLVGHGSCCHIWMLKTR